MTRIEEVLGAPTRAPLAANVVFESSATGGGYLWFADYSAAPPVWRRADDPTVISPTPAP